MAEHYTQGRQGQGARRRHHHHKQGRHYRQRMPRPEEAPASKPSLLQRVLRFFGFGKATKAGKDDKLSGRKQKDKRNTPPQKVRIAKTNNNGGNPAAKGRKRATSTPPTRNARLYVGNLAYEATESELEDLFKGFGNVRSVEIIYNPRTYKSKGYAFVEMYQLADAQKAAEVLHGQPFMGRELMVSAASEKPENATPEAATLKNTAPETPMPEAAPEADAPAVADAPATETPAEEAPAEKSPAAPVEPEKPAPEDGKQEAPAAEQNA